MSRLMIAVLFGGCSPEYGVSLQSAAAVLRHMDQSRYEPVMVGISQAGDWFRYTGPVDSIESDTWHNAETCVPAVMRPDRSAPALLVFGPEGMRNVHLDAAFPVLHGRNGEDGTVQGLFELAGIPLVGCGVLASALCMDKDRAHKLAQAAGVAVPRSAVLERWMGVTVAMAEGETLGYPLFVKPVRAGSSYGITKVMERGQLPAALELAFQYDDQIIMEEAIPGFEVGCAVLGNETLTVGEPDEIELAGGFFNFTEKYTLETSAIHVPARITAEQREQIKASAKRIYRALGCQGFARVDQFLTTEGRLVFNEVNTIPGFTAHSRYPNMMKAAGMSFEQVISALIELAVKKMIVELSQVRDLMLVNQEHPISWNPQSLVLVGGRVLMDERAASALNKLMEELDGWRFITAVSGWRSQEEQHEIYIRSLGENGEEFTKQFVARPGHSEHQTGLAIDLGLTQPDIDFLRPYFPYEGICQTFRERAAAYGFIERYPAGKEAVTGIAHEPWHFRYVGVPHAEIIVEHGWTLEEYHKHQKPFSLEVPT